MKSGSEKEDGKGRKKKLYKVKREKEIEGKKKGNESEKNIKKYKHCRKMAELKKEGDVSRLKKKK